VVLGCASVWTAFPQIETVYLSVAAAETRKIPIYCVSTDAPKVAISFDAAWGADDTETLLSILQSNGIKATFFLCGYWIDKYPDEVKRIFEEGHDVGNHGNTHAHGAQLNLEQNKSEIQGVHDKLKALIGTETFLFRPPYGEYNNTVISAAESLGYYTIQWDVDTLDIKTKKAHSRP
jgi:peptidoglycan/xylan/chitin deacetylase (PgdA/CDA1 family)